MKDVVRNCFASNAYGFRRHERKAVITAGYTDRVRDDIAVIESVGGGRFIVLVYTTDISKVTSIASGRRPMPVANEACMQTKVASHALPSLIGLCMYVTPTRIIFHIASQQPNFIKTPTQQSPPHQPTQASTPSPSPPDSAPQPPTDYTNTTPSTPQSPPESSPHQDYSPPPPPTYPVPQTLPPQTQACGSAVPSRLVFALRGFRNLRGRRDGRGRGLVGGIRRGRRCRGGGRGCAL